MLNRRKTFKGKQKGRAGLRNKFYGRAQRRGRVLQKLVNTDNGQLPIKLGSQQERERSKKKKRRKKKRERIERKTSIQRWEASSVD